MNPYINSDAAILRGEEIEASILEIKDTTLHIDDRWEILETIADCISDDEYDDLAWSLTND